MKTTTLVMAAVLAAMMAGAAFAGSLEAPAAPDNPASAMYTIESIYQRLTTGAAGTKRVGTFAEPASGPGSTGHTFDDVMSKAPAVDNVNGAKPENVEKGKTFWGLRSDGTWGLQTGTKIVVCNGTLSSGGRWCDQNNGTVMDISTGLVWVKSARCFGGGNWDGAISWFGDLKSGTCGLTDGSVAGDWRLPTINELRILTTGTEQLRYNSPGPFTYLSASRHWSSTSYFYVGSPNFVMVDVMTMEDGTSLQTDSSAGIYALGVRSQK